MERQLVCGSVIVGIIPSYRFTAKRQTFFTGVLEIIKIIINIIAGRVLCGQLG